MIEPTTLIEGTTSMTDIFKYVSFGTLVLIAGSLVKFYSYAKTQTIKEEELKNRIFNLEKDVASNKNNIEILKDKTDDEFKMLVNKMDTLSQIQSQKTEEIKNLIIELFRDK